MKHEPGESRYRFRKTKNRVEIFKRAIDRILPKISATSESQAIDQSVKLGERYLDRMAEAKKQVQKKRDRIEELEKEIEELKQKWETEEIGFDDI